MPQMPDLIAEDIARCIAVGELVLSLRSRKECQQTSSEHQYRLDLQSLVMSGPTHDRDYSPLEPSSPPLSTSNRREGGA